MQPPPRTTSCPLNLFMTMEIGSSARLGRLNENDYEFTKPPERFGGLRACGDQRWASSFANG